MKLRSFILLLVVLLSACTMPGGSTPTVISAVTPASTATQALPTAVYAVTPAPDARSAVTRFLQAWQVDDYAAMYGMLSSLSRDAIVQEDFVNRYRDVAINMTLQKVDFEILSALTHPSTAQVAYRVNFITEMVGDLSRDMEANLALENGEWKIKWEDGMIMPELRGGNTLRIDYDSPSRGNIYDRYGAGVALFSDSVALGVTMGQYDTDQEGQLISVVSKVTGKHPEAIRALLKDAGPGEYVPLGEISKETEQRYLSSLSAVGGLERSAYTGRLYPYGGIAPHVSGYVSAIQKEELDQYLRMGYMQSDRVGRAGLEAWGEKILTGTRGATLDVYDPKGLPVTRLKKVDKKPAQHIYMTIDADLQLAAQQAMSGFDGGLVVMERDTGRILALVSSPGFNPNAFDFNNANWQSELTALSSDPRTPLYNRATMDGFPLGSVFKIITLAATLETGAYSPDDTLDCQYKWYPPDGSGRFYTDWTFEKDYPPSGILTLPEALVRSCDPWFYQMGYKMFTDGHPQGVSDMARAFGLGSITGVKGLHEMPGKIEDPSTWAEAVEMAIGQWTVLVNPLQVARYIAAVGNGGTLYRPQVIEKIADADGNPSEAFAPEVTGKLPVTAEHLRLIQDAMRDVVSSPRGTAVQVFGGLSIPIYGKTGTAQNDWVNYPHAWFGGYTNANRPDKPDIAVVVIAEHAGEGSEIAAPIFRRIIEIYFLGQPQAIYPWESKLNVTKTPTPAEGQQPSDSGSGGDTGGGDSGGDINLSTATPSP